VGKPVLSAARCRLAAALRRTAAAHGEHEKEIGRADPDWPDWYAQYMMDEQAVNGRPADREQAYECRL
jgi:hypothetical protein